jgi:hypothetical protein
LGVVAEVEDVGPVVVGIGLRLRRFRRLPA